MKKIIEKYLKEAYMAGKGSQDTKALFRTAHGFLDDTEKMYDYGNIEGAIKSIGIIKNKVLSDLSKSMK